MENTDREIYNAIPAALWISTTQKVVKNPSLASQLLRLGSDYEGIGQQDVRVDGDHRVVDAFQVHDIVARNSFGIPTPTPQSAKADQWGVYTSQSDGSSNLNPQNSAIFCHAALINHSCLSNVEKRFMGDLIIVRAYRSIGEGEEILLDYAPGLFNDARSRSNAFARTWQFSCDCQLCVAESQQPDETLDLRIALTAEAHALSEELSRNMPTSVSRDADIGRLVALAKQLEASYAADELPKCLAYVYTTLALLHGGRKDFSSHMQAITQGFESLGWVCPLETGGMLHPMPGFKTVLDLNIPQLL